MPLLPGLRLAEARGLQWDKVALAGQGMRVARVNGWIHCDKLSHGTHIAAVIQLTRGKTQAKRDVVFHYSSPHAGLVPGGRQTDPVPISHGTVLAVAILSHCKTRACHPVMSDRP